MKSSKAIVILNIIKINLFKLFNFKGQNILIFGGSGYLGLEISKSFLEYGANVIVIGRSLKKLNKIINYANKKKFKNLKTYALDISSTSGLKILDTKIHFHPMAKKVILITSSQSITQLLLILQPTDEKKY